MQAVFHVSMERVTLDSNFVVVIIWLAFSLFFIWGHEREIQVSKLDELRKNPDWEPGHVMRTFTGQNRHYETVCIAHTRDAEVRRKVRFLDGDDRHL